MMVFHLKLMLKMELVMERVFIIIKMERLVENVIIKMGL